MTDLLNLPVVVLLTMLAATMVILGWSLLKKFNAWVNQTLLPPRYLRTSGVRHRAAGSST